MDEIQESMMRMILALEDQGISEESVAALEALARYQREHLLGWNMPPLLRALLADYMRRMADNLAA